MNLSNVSWDKRIETELLNWNTELRKFSFISLNHVGMRLSDFLQFSLDLTNSFVLELLYLLKRAADHAKSLGINSSSCQNLVRLSILRLESLLDRLQLLLKDEVAKTCLAMDIVDNAVESLKELFFLLLDVLELLEAHFILPLHLLILLLSLHNLLLLVGQIVPNLVIFDLQIH